jgi:hypothetical protein
MALKLGIILRIASALIAAFLFWISPASLFMASVAFTGYGPAGRAGPPSATTGLLFLLPTIAGLVFALLAVWPLIARIFGVLFKRPRNVEDEYRGPRCVACREPIAAGIQICPNCGWTQPV